MKQRTKMATLVSLSQALDVNFSLFDALDEAEANANAKRLAIRKTALDNGRARSAYTQAR